MPPEAGGRQRECLALEVRVDLRISRPLDHDMLLQVLDQLLDPAVALLLQLEFVPAGQQLFGQESAPKGAQLSLASPTPPLVESRL